MSCANTALLLINQTDDDAMIKPSGFPDYKAVYELRYFW